MFHNILNRSRPYAQEARLLNLPRAIVSGRPLLERDHPLEASGVGEGGASVQQIPIIASTKSYLDESLHVSVQRLAIP